MRTPGPALANAHMPPPTPHTHTGGSLPGTPATAGATMCLPGTIAFGYMAAVDSTPLRILCLDALDLMTSQAGFLSGRTPGASRRTVANTQLVASGVVTPRPAAVLLPRTANAISPTQAELESNPDLMRQLVHRPGAIDPYTVGPARGSSSTLTWASPMLPRQTWHEIRLERTRGQRSLLVEQTPFFPNYAPIRSAWSAAVARWLQRRGWQRTTTSWSAVRGTTCGRGAPPASTSSILLF